MEEFEVEAEVVGFYSESIHHYEDKSIRLLAYLVTFEEDITIMHDHDELRWVRPEVLDALTWAPADLPIVRRLMGE
jgi:8-oxo-dGTP diphosphatase